MSASFATIVWEVSTGDPTRARAIGEALTAALRPFSPCPLLVNLVLIDSELQPISVVRRALDGVQSQFPVEFFWSSSDHADADIQGLFPPFANLELAHAITGSRLNPRQRGAVPAALAPAPRAARKARAKGARRRRARRTGH